MKSGNNKFQDFCFKLFYNFNTLKKVYFIILSPINTKWVLLSGINPPTKKRQNILHVFKVHTVAFIQK